MSFNKPVAFAQPGEWSVASGVMNRQIDTSFSFPTPNLSAMSLINQRRDATRGPLPLFSYDLDGTVQEFDQGTIGPGTYADGGVDAVYELGALTLTDRGYYLSGRNGGEGPSRMGMTRVHRLQLSTDGGTSYDYSTEGNWSNASASDTANATGGFVETRYGLNVLGQGWINVLLGWRFAEADAGSQRSHGTIIGRESRTDQTHLYEYDVVQFPASGPRRGGPGGQELDDVPLFIGPMIPYKQLFLTPEEYAIFDAAIAGGDDENFYGVHSEAPNPFLDPTQTTKRSSRSRVVDVFEARSGANLDLTLQELVVAAEWAIEFAGQGRFAWSAGPTLNIIQADLDAWQGVYNQAGAAVYMQAWEDSDTHVRAGFMSQATFTWIFVPEGRTFVEGYGGYRYVDTLDLNAGPVGASIDASSYEAGVGLACDCRGQHPKL